MERISREMEDFLEDQHGNLKKIPHVLNVFLGTKIVGGVNTGEPCITFLVSEKVEESKLLAMPSGLIPNIIPKTIGKYRTDVLELKPTTWKAGKTAVSELSPREQKRLLGAYKKMQQTVKEEPLSGIVYEVDWEAVGKCTPVEDQGQCGSCCAFGTEQAWQDDILVLKSETMALSPQHLFFCSGGGCSVGNTMEATLNFAVNNGVALEQDCPYSSGSGLDLPCGAGLNGDWYLRGKKLDSWKGVMDKVQTKDELSKKPLVTTMTVYDDFFNYVSGVYTPTVTTVAGGHCIEAVGCSDSRQCWKSKNSWGIGWGMSGYFKIAYGVCGFDDEMYVLTLSDAPIPPPPNPPKPCPWSVAVVKLPGGRWFLRHYRAIRKYLFDIDPGVYGTW